MNSINKTFYISLAIAALAAVMPLSASASYLPDYQGPTFEHITGNVRMLASAYAAEPSLDSNVVVATVTDIQPLHDVVLTSTLEAAAGQASAAPDLAYIPDALYETAVQLSDALAPVGEAYAGVLVWIGDVQADSYRQTAAAVMAYNQNFEGLSDAQMLVYQDVSDSLVGGLQAEAAVAQAMGQHTFSLYDWWTGLIAGNYYRSSPAPLAYADAGDGSVVVAAYTVIVPLHRSP